MLPNKINIKCNIIVTDKYKKLCYTNFKYKKKRATVFQLNRLPRRFKTSLYLCKKVYR